MTDDAFNPPMRLDAHGFPILEEVVEEIPDEQIPTLQESLEDNAELLQAETLKAQILAELEPRLTGLVQTAFINTVKMVAVQMKQQFERDLHNSLKTELAEMVDRAVDQSLQETSER